MIKFVIIIITILLIGNMTQNPETRGCETEHLPIVPEAHLLPSLLFQ